MAHQAVSGDMGKVLDHLAGEIPKGKEKDAADLNSDNSINAAYTRCTWYAGCYYCQDATGRWHLIRCIA